MTDINLSGEEKGILIIFWFQYQKMINGTSNCPKIAMIKVYCWETLFTSIMKGI